MMIDHPGEHQIPQLRALWKAVFADEDPFLDRFFSIAYHPDSCLCAFRGEKITGMVYWLPCGRGADKIAYLYGVATHPDHRGQGICRSLIQAAHNVMQRQGYAGVLLRPQEEGLREMYRKLGYGNGTTLTEGICSMGTLPAPMHPITREEYWRLRPEFLPPNSVAQDSPFPELLETYLRFYKGLGFLMAARMEEDHLFCAEYLGDTSLVPGVLSALGAPYARFRIPGDKRPFTMFHPLQADIPAPGYFAFALD